MKDIFEIEDMPHNLRHTFLVRINNVRSAYYGNNAATFFGPRIWDIISEVCQNTNSLLVFKENIKKWIPEDYPCRISKIYVKRNA